MRLAALLAAFLAVASPLVAQEVVADLSQNRVSITTSFAGSRIVVFGAVKPDPGESPATNEAAAPLEVIVTISGPVEPVTIRKKERRAGIWLNARSVEIAAVPTFYKIASTRPLSKILSPEEIDRHRISIPLAVRAADDAARAAENEAFVDAVIRIRTRDGLYQEMPFSVRLLDQTLFRSDIDLPANLVEGTYTARIFLARDMRVVAEFNRSLEVRKVGIERWVYTLAQDEALIYGVLSLALAIAAGWGASAAFRYVRGS